VKVGFGMHNRNEKITLAEPIAKVEPDPGQKLFIHIVHDLELMGKKQNSRRIRIMQSDGVIFFHNDLSELSRRLPSWQI
jgi:hypothetical protein